MYLIMDYFTIQIFSRLLTLPVQVHPVLLATFLSSRT